MIEYIYSEEKKPTFMCVWDLGRRCNFDCTYCTAWMHSTTAPLNKFEQYKKTAKFIDQYYALYSMFHKREWRPVISFTGGEPTVNPAFYDLLKHMKENYPQFQLNLTTNGTWSTRKAEELIQSLSSITISYHCEGNPKQKQLARENMLWMRDKTKLRVNVMMHMDYWDECVDLMENYLTPNNISFIPRIIGDDGKYKDDWFKDEDGAMRRTTHTYTLEQQQYLKQYWEKKNNKPGIQVAEDGFARKMGRMCCGGRCMTVGNSGEQKDVMFIEQSDFYDWNCMINWFFLHIEEDNDAVYHHQTCRAKFEDAPPVKNPHKYFKDKTRVGMICNLSSTDEYLSWLENKIKNEGRLPTMVCPNRHCGCGICVPKAKNKAVFDDIKSKYVY